MPNIAYISNRFLPLRSAKTSITDRGYQFADAAYEVVTFVDDKMLDFDLHIQRLWRTLSALKMDMPCSPRALELLTKTLIQKNYIHTGMVYFQVSRGIAPRSHIIPQNMTPVLSMICTRLKRDILLSPMPKALSVALSADLRHKRCDLKTVGLLPNVLSLDDARINGFDDALFYDENGCITEGTSWNFWILDKDNILRTRYLDNHILHGITRHTVMKCAENMNLKIIESDITLSDIHTAKEAFATSASKFAVPIKKIGDIVLPDDNPVTLTLRQAYIDYFLQPNKS